MSDPRDWATANAILQRNGKPVPTRKIANNTHLQRRHCCNVPPSISCVAVKFHDTDIVTFHNNSRITLDSGGWLTMSTKERMNRYLPDSLRVDSYNARGRWEVGTANRQEASVLHARHAFHDGMVLVQRYSGSFLKWVCLNALTDDDIAAQDKHNQRINDLIKRFLDDARNKLPDKIPGYASTAHHLECALCLRTGVGKLVGDEFEDKQHLIDHLIELRVPYTVWMVACEQNGGIRRMDFRDLADRDLRKYLRNALYVGAVATKGGKRPAHSDPWRLAI